jgi:hypothetical protein
MWRSVTLDTATSRQPSTNFIFRDLSEGGNYKLKSFAISRGLIPGVL